MFFSHRPRRVATVRTRLGTERALQSISALIGRRESPGLRGGSVAIAGFDLEYRFDAPKNPQDYLVHGRVEDTGDWRLVRLDIQAQEPWIHPLMVLMVPVALGVPVYVGELSVAGLVTLTAAVVAFFGIVNLLYVPGVVARRVTQLVAEAVHGSVVTET